MDEKNLIGIFKLGQKAHMEELLGEGHVYMNTLSYFATLEDGTPRSDNDEGIGYCQNAEGWSLEMQEGDEWHTLGTLCGAVRFRDSALSTANVYCLHGLTQLDYGRVFELNQLGFGESYVLFLNPNEFFRRLQKAVDRAGHKMVWGMVDYVDRRNHTGSMGVFRKFSEREVDREVRVAILPGSGCPFSLHLGDLSDIAIIGSTSQRLRLDSRVSSNQQLPPTSANSERT